MDPYDLLVFVHVIAVIIWTGGALIGMLIGGQIRKSGDSAAFGKFCSAFATIAGPWFGTSGLLTIISGAWLVSMDGGAEFSDLWISLGMGGWLVSLVMGATIVGMSWTKVGVAIGEHGKTIEDVQPQISKAVMWTWIDLGIRTAVILVMVWKPL